MHFIIKTTPEELIRARNWWLDLEIQWKMAYNEAVYGKGPTLEPPQDEELMILLLQIDTLRFAGPSAAHPNMSTVLTNLSGLIPLYHLSYLSISNMDISSLAPLQQFTRMKHLFAFENKLTSLQGIEGMKELESLYVQNNAISDLIPISNLLNIKTLYVNGNKLKDARGITENHVPSLENLFILPNNDLPQKEILRIQNELGLICRRG
ncbi:MAG: leucine-rich repeat domain-containing protein [Saprospiraceae bacterium]|nr:leucine-rich repeat domain-containing protein [Saprospiraceae bacterium]MCB0666718.1 leucine-rich repeat domain-containing protein [Saprospiraceae bacterium]MCB9320603.1 leucine-rich repeat domain-containing protein [Lewinellaceae bacterium]